MIVLLNNPDELFAWLKANGFKYAVLRGFANMGENWRDAHDRAILLEDDALAALTTAKRCGISKWRGAKLHLYSVSGAHGGGLAGQSCFPQNLAHAILKHRVAWQGHFYIPAPPQLYHTLLYHFTYQLAEESLAHVTEPTPFSRNSRSALMRELARQVGEPCDFSLLDMHRVLAARDYGIDIPRAAAYLQAQFKYRFKSHFYALLLARELPGEVNMFMLRAKVIRHGFRELLMGEIRCHYTIWAVKEIPHITRMTKSRYMRGNKWRWGGWPAVAVVVFDPAPLWRGKQIHDTPHPLVFNERQFFKRELRERIVAQGKLYHKINALHSTDNEAEAIGHYDLFFTPQEQAALYAAAEKARATLPVGGLSDLSFNQVP